MVRILSIDGGGIRGIIPATVLVEIEKRTERRICELFDFVAGTSTGGILALGLTRAGDEPRALATRRRTCATSTWSGEPRSSRHFVPAGCEAASGSSTSATARARSVDVLKEYMGGARLKDALCPVLVTGV